MPWSLSNTLQLSGRSGGTQTTGLSVTQGIGKVYVVDDDVAVLEMLLTLVATIGVSVRGFSCGEDFFAEYARGHCECLVCDMRLPDIDGMEVQRRLSALNPELPIIFLTGYAEVDIAVEAMKHGAFDFVQKPFGAQSLLGKIQSALELSRRKHADWLKRQTIDARLELLTPRERDLIPHIVDGKTSREISELLGLSVRTVENHRTRIMDKLHVGSTVDLVKLFL